MVWGLRCGVLSFELGFRVRGIEVWDYGVGFGDSGPGSGIVACMDFLEQLKRVERFEGVKFQQFLAMLK